MFCKAGVWHLLSVGFNHFPNKMYVIRHNYKAVNLDFSFVYQIFQTIDYNRFVLVRLQEVFSNEEL